MANNPLARSPLWVSGLLLLVAGASQTLTLSPWEWWWLGPISMALIVFTIMPLATRHLFLAGWLTGVGLYGSGVTWIYISISEHGNTSTPIAVILMALFVAGVAIVHGLAFWFWGKLGKDSPARRLILFPAVWVLADWVRGWLLTGFPWLYLGTAHVDGPLAGWAPVAGVHGITLIVAGSGSALYALYWLFQARRRTSAGVVAALTLALWLAGPALNRIQWTDLAEEPLSFAAMQGNIPQQIKWDPDFLRDQLVVYLGLTEDDWNRDIILWPETAIPITQDQAGPIIEHIASELGAGSTLVTGIPWYTFSDRREDYTFHNSIMAIGEDAEGVYHKQKLVPFGEYVPLENWLRGLIGFFDLPMSSFSRGPAYQAPLEAGDTKLTPAICYEVAYPDFVAFSARRGNMLVTISNDGWFGDSIGPHQHLQMARMRALETGRYMLRGTNNGVTAIIDEKGQVTERIPQFERAVMRGEVYSASGLTPFMNTGSWPVLTLVAILIVFVRVRVIPRN
ncbi:Apolipoprotein N-acyltransferase [Marinobacter daqiaonensis]|uniref:Apolipoprotein N-acyltransferase n=1 Tax=Marinobacter daqiaonensis TaxID=650891 RepID=A0A1I6HCI1_9GAMM|nr:apolipoprotein N-acyltransferase [Marinobacter daqiaonensis]SFR52215.1 Apolipoprotein N-acyltransferase [Marinobacter daqiaonensis]